MIPHTQPSKAEAERLHMLAEEAGEIVQACMKILRHGYHSFHPGRPNGTNLGDLEREIGNFQELVEDMVAAGDLMSTGIAMGRDDKRTNKKRYTYCQPYSELSR